MICHVCKKEITPDVATFAYWHEPDKDVALCPDHAECRDHTCKGMLERHLMSLEFEARREEGQDRDDTMDAIDSVRRKIDKLS